MYVRVTFARVVAFALLVVFAVLVAGCGGPPVETVVVYQVVTNTPEPPPTDVPAPTAAPTPATWLTLDGYEGGVLVVKTINIWKDYNDRNAGVAATGKHGEMVKLIRRSGDGVKIETKVGKQGWVTYYFVKEYK